MDALCIEARAKLEKSQNCQPAGRHRTKSEQRKTQKLQSLYARAKSPNCPPLRNGHATASNSERTVRNWASNAERTPRNERIESLPARHSEALRKIRKWHEGGRRRSPADSPGGLTLPLPRDAPRLRQDAPRRAGRTLPCVSPCRSRKSRRGALRGWKVEIRSRLNEQAETWQGKTSATIGDTGPVK